MQVVALRFRLHQVVAAHEAGRQAHAAAALDHQHRQVAAGAHPLLEGAAGRPGGAHVALGVLDPVLNDLDQLLQEGEAATVAAHQRLLGHIHGGGIVLAVGQPALQAAEQVRVQPADGHRQLGHLLIQAGLDQRRREGFHLAGGRHREGARLAEEAGTGDRVAAGGEQVVELARVRAHLEAIVDQPLEAVRPWPQAEAVRTQQHGLGVAVLEPVDQAGAHARS